MALRNNNPGWTLESVGVDHMTNGEDQSELVTTYRHTDGRGIQHCVDFFIMGDVQVNSERPNYALDGFVTMADDAHDRAISEAGEDDTVTRSFWIYPASETLDPLDTDGELITDWSDNRSEVDDGWIDLDYTGRYDATGSEFDDEIKAKMTAWGENNAEWFLYGNDLERMFSDLTEGL